MLKMLTLLENANTIYVFFYYGCAVIAPFFLFSCVSSVRQGKDAPTRSLTVILSQYVAKFPLMICLYHLLLTLVLSAFCVQEVAQNMSVAVDLNYYTKTSIRATEAYDAIQDGKFEKSFYNWYFHLGGDGSRRLEEEKFKDFVAIYHSSDSWDNVLTSDALIDMCNAEKTFLASQSCMGSEVASILETVMTTNCTYKQSFEEALFVFGLEENALYVEDNVSPTNPQSSVVLSYYATTCKVKLNSVDASVSSVENTYGATINMAYVHSDLVTDAFIASGISDVQLSLFAMIVCYTVLSMSVGLKFMFGVLFMLCIILSLAVAAGTLPLFGFAYFSAFNVLAIFVITGVGADAIIVFCSAWYKKFSIARIEALSYSQSITNESPDLLDNVDMMPYFPLVLYNAYTSVVTALTFTVLTTILSFLANLVSPIVVIAQLGAFMGTAMTVYFVLLHLVLIPAWVFVMKADQYVSLCSPCLEMLSKCLRCCNQITSSTGPNTNANAACQSTACITNQQERGEVPQTMNEMIRVEDSDSFDGAGAGGRENSALEDDGTVLESFDEGDGNDIIVSSRSTNVRSPEVENGDGVNDFDMSDIYEGSAISKPTVVKRKQSLWLGCGAFLGLIAAMIIVTYGITEVLDTDFGLPVLFKEGTNMADLMYVAKNYKSDILTLGNSGGSSTSPDPGTSDPSIMPTVAPSHFPTVLTMSPTPVPTAIPTLSPTPVPTAVPSHEPTRAPTAVPSLSPTLVPTVVPTASPTPLPTGTPIHSPTGIPSQSPTSFPTSPTSAPSSGPTSTPTISTAPTLTPSSFAPSLSPSSYAPTLSPSESVSPSAVPSGAPTSTPSSSTPSSCPSGAPSSNPSLSPSGSPSSMPSADPSATPSSLPTFPPTGTPSSIPTTATPTLSPTTLTLSPSTVAELAATGNTFYTVFVCYGIDIDQDKVDTEPTAKVDPESFARYAEEGGLLSDIQILCDYLAAEKIYMEVAMLSSDCLYDQLMAVTADGDDEEINIFQRIGLWMAEEKERAYQVGVQETEEGTVVSGNFGQDLNLWLTFLCQPIDCRADVSSFFNDPDHALTMIDRWDYAMYDVGSVSADAMDVVPLTGSDAWLFPLLSNRIVSSIYVSSGISFMGCLVLICLATRNFKLSLLIGIGMLFVMITSLLLHAMLFSPIIDLIDIIVIISFVGIIIDYPTHMAFHYEMDLKLREKLAKDGILHTDGHGGLTAQQEEDHFHKHSFSYMRLALIGPAVTTVFSALPLMFAEFSIISKAGEYVVIMCVCTYLYVAFVMPTILRLVGELIFVPCRYSPQNSLHMVS